MGCARSVRSGMVLARSTGRDVGGGRADHLVGEVLDRAGQHVRVGSGAAQPDHYHEKPAGQPDRMSGPQPGGRAAGRLPVGWFGSGGRDAGPSHGATERCHCRDLTGHLARPRRTAKMSPMVSAPSPDTADAG